MSVGGKPEGSKEENAEEKKTEQKAEEKKTDPQSEAKQSEQHPEKRGDEEAAVDATEPCDRALAPATRIRLHSSSVIIALCS